jgi:hypothetical protein
MKKTQALDVISGDIGHKFVGTKWSQSGHISSLNVSTLCFEQSVEKVHKPIVIQ